MAAPPTVTIRALDGIFVMNRTLSTDVDALLQLQHISWFMRKAISLATVTLTITSSTDTNDVPHIDIAQRATGGISASSENRTLDWAERDHDDNVFGKLRGQSRFVLLPEEADGKLGGDKFLSERWLAEREGGDGKVEVVQARAKARESDWSAEQTWGFETVGEEGRRYVRHVVVTNEAGKREEARLVYDYLGARAD